MVISGMRGCNMQNLTAKTYSTRKVVDGDVEGDAKHIGMGKILIKRHVDHPLGLVRSYTQTVQNIFENCMELTGISIVALPSGSR